jgi:hypothetical protein
MCERNHCSCAECREFERKAMAEQRQRDPFSRDVRRLQRLERQRRQGGQRQ